MRHLLIIGLAVSTLGTIFINQTEAQSINNKAEKAILENIRSIKRPWEKRRNHTSEVRVLSMNTTHGTIGDTLAPEWVNHYASGLVNSTDQPNDMAVDDDGNIYVTGSSDSTFTGQDYMTIKYNSQGVALWTARYNGPGSSFDEAAAIAVDGSGNVYVTGQSYGEGSNPEFATIKYNSSGSVIWEVRYSEMDDFSYTTRAIAVDDSGNVYVTGECGGSSSYWDYITIKYNSSGTEQWTATFNGAANSDDFVRGIVVDDSGNVYVAGYSQGIGTSYDFATVKYNRSGGEEWRMIYQGPGVSADFANAIEVDGAGNVYVTGSSDSVGRSADYTTIKYNSSGATQWISRYNGTINGFDVADAIAVDTSGNVYVTGFSRGLTTGYDYATVKYNSAGNEQWVMRYNGPGNYDDRARKITVDTDGNVYVIGSSAANNSWPYNDDYATIKYDSSGVEQWVNRYDGPGADSDFPAEIALDKQGNIIVTGYSIGTNNNQDFATIKYNSSGAVRWATRYNGSGTSSCGSKDIVVDQTGNLFVTSVDQSSVTSYDFMMMKYNSTGNQQWITRYNGPDNREDVPLAMAADSSGNVYVTGSSYNSTTLDDFVTVKYNSLGEEQWTARYNGTGNDYDWAIAITIDGTGNLYVTGTSKDSITGYNFATVKYNSSGIEQWVATYNGPGNDYDIALSITCDAGGNVYITGISEGSGTGSDYCTIKYNSAGAEQWVARYDGPLSDYDSPYSIAIDGAGNTYVTGTSQGSGTGSDYATIKYDSLGTEQWVARYDSPESGDEETSGIVIDKNGNIYVTGSSYRDSTSSDYLTVKYNPSGTQQWVVAYNDPENNSDYAAAIALDATGNLYVTGYSESELTAYDIVTIKYDSLGTEAWTARYNGLGNTYDTPSSIAVDQQGNVFVSGESGKDSWSVLTTIKYPSTLVSVEENNDIIADRYYLYQNYPNPFNPNTIINYQLPAAGWVTLKVYNLLGQEVKTLVNEFKLAGGKSVTFNATNLPSGVYTYRLTSGTYTKCRKMVILK